MSSGLKKTIQLVAIFAIGIAFLYAVFNNTNWAELWQRFTEANYFWIAIGMAVSLLSHWMRAYRATMLYEPLGFKVSTLNSFNAVIIGYFMNYFIPRGGEISRCAALLKTNNIPVEKGIGTVITERLVDMVMLLIILGLVFLLQFDVLWNYINQNQNTQTEKSNFWWIVLIGLAVVAIVFFALHNKLKQTNIYKAIAAKLLGFVQGLTSIKNIKQPVLFVALSAGIWLCYVLMMYFCLFALTSTSHLTFVQGLTVFAMGTIGIIIPAPGAGAGTYHFAVMQGLLLFNVAQADGIAYATIVHGAQMVLFILLGLISSLMVFGKRKTN